MKLTEDGIQAVSTREIAKKQEFLKELFLSIFLKKTI
jgi:hypothetical protein